MEALLPYIPRANLLKRDKMVYLCIREERFNEVAVVYFEVAAATKLKWGWPDSNWRRPKSMDLQSIAIATMRHPQKGIAGERN